MIIITIFVEKENESLDETEKQILKCTSNLELQGYSVTTLFELETEN
jgi:hypothetical protein